MSWIEFLCPTTISVLTLGVNVALAVGGHRPRRPGSPMRGKARGRAIAVSVPTHPRGRSTALDSRTSR